MEGKSVVTESIGVFRIRGLQNSGYHLIRLMQDLNHRHAGTSYTYSKTDSEFGTNACCVNVVFDKITQKSDVRCVVQNK